MWTTRMLLDCIVCSDMKTSRQAKNNLLLQNEHDKIVALLKAFDLYVEEKQAILDKDYNKVGEEYGFDISDFLRGNFITKRSEKEAISLLNEVVDNNRLLQQAQEGHAEKDVYFFLSNVFKGLITFRRDLQCCIDYYNLAHWPEIMTNKFVLLDSMKEIKPQANKIDIILLKIIGDKKPVSEKVLIKKYGFPKSDLLAGLKSVKEILAAL